MTKGKIASVSGEDEAISSHESDDSTLDDGVRPGKSIGSFDGNGTNVEPLGSFFRNFFMLSRFVLR